ncbi:hypothetical protein JRI60_06470 [Archangium violaceum]|uniref:hypothetical protein n=1 Tax=Archangium violaceum TaxID=83451 RepID=UPI001951ABBB|nr:hypothetical protein [Archangium violaceum]QRN98687.1 hypothetical protein JRI60_06470 [Archangium violaceum]
MHMLSRVAVLLVLGLLAWPMGAWACSCSLELDVRDALETAREKAELIFRGRVDDIHEDFGEDYQGPYVGRATFTVLETFKGKAAPKRVLSLSDNMCEYLFDKGVEYLVYASGSEKQGFGTSVCTRTQSARGASVEMESLRSGILPRRPVAMRRQHLSCTRCDVEAVARSLVCGDKAPCEPSEGKTSEDALREGRPFWELAARDTREERAIFGVGLDGRAFQLVQRPNLDAEEACEQRVLRRGCERLSLEPAAHGARVTCTGPSEEEPLCDEKATRRASWGPVEAPPRGVCDWGRADAPRCEWDSETVPLAPGAPTRPGLVCTTGHRGNMVPCRVVPDAASTPPAVDGP